LPVKEAVNVIVNEFLFKCCTSPTTWLSAESTVVTEGNLFKLCVIVTAVLGEKEVDAETKFLSVCPFGEYAIA
tara:strand:+ start:421 stop:639 length:219 start_codon:yes stop_codon:yes gene_type:complete